MPRKCHVPNLTCVIVDEGCLQLLDCIGRGSFGAVYRARDLTQPFPSLLAVKVVPKDCKLQYYWREISALRRVQRHPNVIAMRRWFEDDNHIYIVLDYCAGGDMWTAIRDRKLFSGNDELVKAIFLQLIDGLEWCHRRGIYHRDLKPNNILISPDCTRVWISDFGLASGTRQCYAFGVGTSNYRSPGCNNISGESIPFDAVRNDIWSLGVILVNMLTGRLPWSAASTKDGWYMAFVRDRNFLRYTLPISEEADYILQHMLADEFENAISLAELRTLVQGVERWWMSDAEVAAGAPHLQRALSYYRRKEPLSLPAINSWDFDSHSLSIGSIERKPAGAAEERSSLPSAPASAATDPTRPPAATRRVRILSEATRNDGVPAITRAARFGIDDDAPSFAANTGRAAPAEMYGGLVNDADLREKRSTGTGSRWSLRRYVHRVVNTKRRQ